MISLRLLSIPLLGSALILSACAEGDGGAPGAEAPAGTLVFNGICDASAAVALGDNTMVVADDESNKLRVYRLDKPGMPVAATPLDAFLGVENAKKPEADLEGAARLGERTFWVTSHGRSKSGKWRAARYRIFATAASADAAAVKPVGTPSSGLLDSLLGLEGVDLSQAVGERGEKEKDLAPKEQGMNIESLSATADGKRLLLGFRNPRPQGKGLLVPIENPTEIVSEGAAPKLGDPILLDLGGLGFRAMEYSPFHQCYLIVAGSSNGGDASRLLRWSGDPAEAPTELRRFPNLNPEALLVFPDRSEIFVVSDDGTVMVKADPGGSTDDVEDGYCECKSLRDDTRKAFRLLRVEVPAK